MCPNGVEVGDLAERVAALRVARDDGSVRLGVTGTVLPSKGVVELVRACEEAAVPGLRVEVHGNLPSYHGDGSYVDELRALEGRHDWLTVHGPFAREELAGILAGLDGVAAPSRWVEVFGLTVREARAAGLPVLVSDAGDLPAVAAGGSAGLVVPAGDHPQWVAAVRRFATDAEARAAWAADRTPVRSAREMALQIERAYVRVVRAATGGGASGKRPGFLARPLPAPLSERYGVAPKVMTRSSLRSSLHRFGSGATASYPP